MADELAEVIRDGRTWPNGLEACGVKLDTRPPGWGRNRFPKCNRQVGHDGPHRDIDVHSFHVRHEWPRGA